MSTTDETGKILRIHGYRSGHSDDGVLTVSHTEITVLRFESREPVPGAGRRVIEDIVKALTAYGPLIRRDDRSFAAIWQTERGVPAYLYNTHGTGAFAPGFRFKGSDEIVVLRLEAVDERHGVRTDGKWADSRSPLTVPRRQLAIFSAEAAADLVTDLQGALDAGHERGDLIWEHETPLPQQPRSRFGELVAKDTGADMSDPSTWDRMDPRRFMGGYEEAVRARRIEAGLEKNYRSYVPGSG